HRRGALNAVLLASTAPPYGKSSTPSPDLRRPLACIYVCLDANTGRSAYNSPMNGATGRRVPSFPFDSPLASKAVALERLRGDLPRTIEHLPVLSELADLYGLMSSIVSARIEGNHTTIVDAIEGAR